MNPNAQAAFTQLQALESQLQSLSMQRQQLQSQLLETQSAIDALAGAESAFRIVGGIMIGSDPVSLKKELSERKEALDIRFKSVERQEVSMKTKAQELQEQVLGQGGMS